MYDKFAHVEGHCFVIQFLNISGRIRTHDKPFSLFTHDFYFTAHKYFTSHQESNRHVRIEQTNHLNVIKLNLSGHWISKNTRIEKRYER
jgi:hypothetical protein